MNKRIILITGSTETLGYFSKQIAAKLCDLDIEVFVWNMLYPLESRSRFENLADPQNSILVTFNFIGLCGEGQFADDCNTVFDRYDIEKVVIMVDSPIYYYKQLNSNIRKLSCICIDENHKAYLEKWFPQYVNVGFIPLMGNLPMEDMWYKPGIMNKNSLDRIRVTDYDLKPLSNRYIDLVFIGNYVPIPGLEESISTLEQSHRNFLMDISKDLISYPDKVLEIELERRLREEYPDEDEKAFPEVMHHMIFVDLYVRSFFRGEMIKNLAEAGYRIHLVGQDWDKLDTVASSNLIYTNTMLSSSECIDALSNSKMSLNIMPWFKAGAHDRIFSSMLAGCATITDSSDYIDIILDKENDYMPFELAKPESVIEAVGKLNADKELMEYIADNGRCKAIRSYTWSHFTDELLDFLRYENN